MKKSHALSGRAGAVGRPEGFALAANVGNASGAGAVPEDVIWPSGMAPAPVTAGTDGAVPDGRVGPPTVALPVPDTVPEPDCV